MNWRQIFRCLISKTNYFWPRGRRWWIESRRLSKGVANLKKAAKYAKSAERITSKRKTTTGVASLIRASFRASYGGVAARQQKRHEVASSRSMRSRMKTTKCTIRRCSTTNLARSVAAAKKWATLLKYVPETRTSALSAQQSRMTSSASWGPKARRSWQQRPKSLRPSCSRNACWSPRSKMHRMKSSLPITRLSVVQWNSMTTTIKSTIRSSWLKTRLKTWQQSNVRNTVAKALRYRLNKNEILYLLILLTRLQLPNTNLMQPVPTHSINNSKRKSSSKRSEIKKNKLTSAMRMDSS